MKGDWAVRLLTHTGDFAQDCEKKDSIVNEKVEASKGDLKTSSAALYEL